MPDATAVVSVSIRHPRQSVPFVQPSIQDLLAWREESMLASSDWRSESWRDCEMYDGNQWSDADRAAAVEAGIPYILTINRTFPTVNLILGSQMTNKYDIAAKGRTYKDSEISQTMTEAIKYVMDQWDGDPKISLAFRDGVIPGVGWLAPGFSSDPRRERVKLSYLDWKEAWWDPYSSPWLDLESCRYFFRQKWMDVADLQALFPEKAAEIINVAADLQGSSTTTRYSSIWDEATQVEEQIRYSIGTGWTISNRQRLRPCEMWYTHYSTGLFALFPNGNCLEISPESDPLEQFAMIRSASEVVSATVKKIRVATFLSELLLADVPSPYPHEQFPFVPFVGYLDRYNFPYGVPRQLRDQEEEINRRRSMALALLNSRRVTVEEDAVSEHMTLQQLYEEANKPDGFLVVRSGGLKDQKIQIQEQAQLAQPQISLLEQSEREVQQISGANAEQMGYKSNAISGTAIERRQVQGATVTAPIFENLRRSLNILGNQLVCLIQGAWTGEKVLRVTDRLSGAEKFVALNQRVTQPDGSAYIRNDITQSKFDIAISQAPMTDTIREANMLIIMEWIKKSPPEIIPHLMIVAMEMSDMPNKDKILSKLKPLLGQDPRDEELTQEQIKQKAVQNLEAQAQKAQMMEQLQSQMMQLDLQGKAILNKKIEAEIQDILSSIPNEQLKAQAAMEKAVTVKDKVQLDKFRTGFETAMRREDMKVKKIKTAHDMESDTHDMSMRESEHAASIQKAQDDYDLQLLGMQNKERIEAMRGRNRNNNTGGSTNG